MPTLTSSAVNGDNFAFFHRIVTVEMISRHQILFLAVRVNMKYLETNITILGNELPPIKKSLFDDEYGKKMQYAYFLSPDNRIDYADRYF